MKNCSSFYPVCGSGTGRSAFVFVFALVFLSASAVSLPAQLVSKGFPVSNPDWEILVTDYGYADLALDRRPGFMGREYLSGEWAGAVYYQGGKNPEGPVWFQPQWYFPDWVSNSDFEVVTGIGVMDPQNPNNDSGFKVYRSVIGNGDVEVAMNYEMIDTQEGIEQGESPAGENGAGISSTSNRYVFLQTYTLKNLTAAPLEQIQFYQFLHGLNMGVALFDDRDYGGPLGEYHFDITQHGESFGFDSRTLEVVEHSDTVAFHSRRQPDAWEVGYFGRQGSDSHAVGKPQVGVHLSVEQNQLSGTDFFQPDEERWVSGAQRYPLGSLAPGESVEIQFLLTIQTSFEVRFQRVVVELLRLELSGNTYTIEFRETSGAPVGFILHKSSVLAPFPSEAWEQVQVPLITFPQQGIKRFEVEIDPAVGQSFFALQPVF